MTTKSKTTNFKERYGPWALVAGGAQGIGEAYSKYAASHGLNVIALDVNQAALDEIGTSLPEQYSIQCLPLKIDLAADDVLDQVTNAIGNNKDVGLCVYNAAISDVGPFFKKDKDLDYEKKKIAVNVTGPLLFCYHFAKPMLARRKGGIVLMGSGAGLKGSPYYASYSASKAYNIALGEALWGEFKPYGVDVLSVAAGLTISTSKFDHLDTSAPNFQTATECVQEAMAALGNEPLMISGEYNRSNWEHLLQLPDKVAIESMANHAVDNFYEGKAPEQNID